MQKEVISSKQAIMLIAFFVLGTSFLLAVGAGAKKDLWISFFIAFAIAIGLSFIHGRILGHLPGKDFYGILESMLGRTVSRVILIPVAIFILQFTSYALRNFVRFISVAGIPDAPPFAPFLGMGIIAALAVYFGIEILGRWSEFFLPFVMVFAIISALLLTKYMNMDNLRPVLDSGWSPVIKGVWSVIALPLGQIAAFLYVLPPFTDKKTPLRVFPLGLVIGAVLILITSIQDVLVLGGDLMSRLYYPTYTALSIIRIGNIIMRLEIVAATIFTLAVYLKVAILVMAICKVTGYILGLDNHRILAMPIVLLIINYSSNAFQRSPQFYFWTSRIWPYYSAIFLVFLPIVFFVLLEFLAAKRKKQKPGDTLYSSK